MSGLRGSSGRPTATYLKLGAFTLVAGLAFALVLGTLKAPVAGDLVTYTAEFADVNGLHEEDAVRIAGVSVGKVTDITVTAAGKATVELTVSRKQQVLDTARLSVRYQNIAGQRFLGIEQTRGSGKPLAAGARIPATRTSAGFDLTELLNGFRPLFDVLDPDEVNQLAATILKVLQDEGGSIPVLLEQTAELTRFVATRDQVFERVLSNLTPFLADLAAQGDEFETTVRELEKLMKGLAEQRDALGASVEELSGLLATGADFGTQIEAPARTVSRNLRISVTAFAANLTSFDGAVVAFAQLVETLGRITSYRNALNIYVCRYDFAVDELVLALPPTDDRYSEVCSG